MLLSLLLSTVLLLSDDLEKREPSAEAPAHSAFAWESAGGLRYVWWLPEGYAADQPANLTVILHGTGLDYRWGFWNNKPGSFRPEDVVVSVDGPSPGQGDSRLFLGEPADAEAFRDLLAEMRETFALRSVFLYGHSQGGFFVVYYAGEFPETVDGVVAHASGAWNWSKMGRKTKEVPIAFMHGSADPVVPYRQSPGSRDAYDEAGFELLHLRRMPRYNHWPNAVRANEALGWCEGMGTEDPERALDIAEELARPKKADEYQYTTPASFSGARDLLRRFEKGAARRFDEVSSKLETRAKRAIAAIEKEGAKHVSALKRSAGRKLTLKGNESLGHLLPLREDFRGVDSVEAWLKGIGFDKLSEKHSRAASDVLEAWYGDGSGADKLEAIVEALPEAFLFDGYPPDMDAKLGEWQEGADRLGVSKKARKGFESIEAWRSGWKDGRRAYEKIWKDWKGL